MRLPVEPCTTTLTFKLYDNTHIYIYFYISIFSRNLTISFPSMSTFNILFLDSILLHDNIKLNKGQAYSIDPAIKPMRLPVEPCTTTLTFKLYDNSLTKIGI